MRERRLMLRNKQQGGGIDEHTLLLLHLDGNPNDSSIYNRQPIRTRNISYTNSKFNQGAYGTSVLSRIEFEPTFFKNLINSYIYTIEFFVKNSVSAKWNLYFGIDDGTTNGFVCRNEEWSQGCQFRYENANQLNFIAYDIKKDSQWHHYALVSDGTVCTFYIDGVSRASHRVIYFSFPNKNLFIGSRDVGFNSGDGDCMINLDEFRISDIARYTSNFTPPTKPFS